MARVTGTTGNDFIHVTGDGRTPPVGANDLPQATADADTITGGGGQDTIFADDGDDVINQNLASDGADSVDGGAGADTVNLAGSSQIRLTFTSSEVGNSLTTDSGLAANQDGGLAVRVQREDANGGLFGATSRYDDEGVTFVAGSGTTFDVRDLVSGIGRGDTFQVVTLGTIAGETLGVTIPGRATYINGGQGADLITDGSANDFLVGGAGADTLTASLGNDSFIGGGGDDSITGGVGNDVATVNVATDGADQIDLGADSDTVNVSGAAQVRLSFTSAEVGNGLATDSGALANQDGGLAVRMQAEDGSDGLTGPITRVDDEGVTFVAAAGTTFDVRDLVSGVARGDQFEIVMLGTEAGDTLGGIQPSRPYYINGGMGDDSITDGSANDFLVGGAGNDTLIASLGNDSFIGGAGSDAIVGGAGNDVATVNVTTDGADNIDLGADSDVVNVNAGSPGQVRLMFTSAEVGNGLANDGGALANQDGGLAVRMQLEDGAGTPGGPLTRIDDEGITFVAGAGVTFDVRDLVSGIARGDQFEVVTLGTNGADTLSAVQSARPYYINGGQGADTITDGSSNDFLVGGAGNDTLTASLGNDSFIGGGGDDSITGGVGNDVATVNVATDGADQINLGADADVVNVSGAAQIRLMFTSAEVGNALATDSGLLAGQDGGLAVRMQAEDGADGLTGPITRVDDEGVTFLAAAGTTFDVRDLVSGVARGDLFEAVTLGTEVGETLTAVQNARPYYINGGMGSDFITGGTASDFLVGGAGNDTLNGRTGVDTMLGGGGNDRFFVDAAGDGIIEAANGGSDEVFANVDYTLGAGQEIELLGTYSITGTGAINLSGNEFAQTLNGNNGANTLNGRGGADSMQGFGGNDRYFVDDVDDMVFEAGGPNGGVDQVFANVSYKLLDGQQVENLATYSITGTDAINLTGNEIANLIVGNNGANVLSGMRGNDTLTGNAGQDTFVFDRAPGADNVDNITDFRAVDDTIQLSQSVFAALSTGTLDASAFKITSGSGNVVDADDRILYDRNTGSLFYDADGSGAGLAVQFATLDNRVAISANDFVVV